jgi:hypothetical protein
MIDLIHIKTVAAGQTGSASCVTYSPQVSGKVIAVATKPVGNPSPSILLQLQDENDPVQEFIIDYMKSSPGKLYPRRHLESNTGEIHFLSGDNYQTGEFAVHGRLKATLSQADPGDTVLFYIWLEI